MATTSQVREPTGSGDAANLWQVTSDLSRRLITLFTRDASGRRPAHGRYEKFQTDPHWKDLILFYEYFHGDTGAGLGASHQTGWTGLVAKLIHQHAEYTLQDKAHEASKEWHFEGKPRADMTPPLPRGRVAGKRWPGRFCIGHGRRLSHPALSRAAADAAAAAV